jgi:acetate kinase
MPAITGVGMRVLVLNAGSSTLKASVVELDPEDPRHVAPPLDATTVSWGSDASRTTGRNDHLRRILDRFASAGIQPSNLTAVGHRVVHGGERFTGPVLLDEATLDDLDGLSELAPLHNPVAVETIRAARMLLPSVPHVAAFDTAFHATLPRAAQTYPIPQAWRAAHGIRRFGFHGLSVQWSVSRAATVLERRRDQLRLLVAHLGSGCSVTAVDAGASVDTSMGFTPLEGLMMGTRSGSIDPGILLHLERLGVVDSADIAEGLEHGSGLLGVSGVSGEMRLVREAAADGDSRASLAIELFTRSAAKAIAAAATALPKVDALVFTGGIGEHDGATRREIVARLAPLGFMPLPDAADTPDGDRIVSASHAEPAVLRIEAREDIVIAQAALSTVAPSSWR